MPRIAVLARLEVTQTPAVVRLIVGSQMLGASPVSASHAFVSRATPADAPLSPRANAVRLQPVFADPPRVPVPVSQLTSCNPYRCVDPLTCAQSTEDSAEPPDCDLSTTGGS